MAATGALVFDVQTTIYPIATLYNHCSSTREVFVTVNYRLITTFTNNVRVSAFIAGWVSVSRAIFILIHDRTQHQTSACTNSSSFDAVPISRIVTNNGAEDATCNCASICVSTKNLRSSGSATSCECCNCNHCNLGSF